MIEDLPDDRRPFDGGDHHYHAAAGRMEDGIDLVHLPDEAGREISKCKQMGQSIEANGSVNSIINLSYLV
jgi:hypothetical protein